MKILVTLKKILFLALILFIAGFFFNLIIWQWRGLGVDPYYVKITSLDKDRDIMKGFFYRTKIDQRTS